MKSNFITGDVIKGDIITGDIITGDVIKGERPETQKIIIINKYERNSNFS